MKTLPKDQEKFREELLTLFNKKYANRTTVCADTLIQLAIDVKKKYINRFLTYDMDIGAIPHYYLITRKYPAKPIHRKNPYIGFDLDALGDPPAPVFSFYIAPGKKGQLKIQDRWRVPFLIDDSKHAQGMLHSLQTKVRSNVSGAMVEFVCPRKIPYIRQPKNGKLPDGYWEQIPAVLTLNLE